MRRAIQSLCLLALVSSNGTAIADPPQGPIVGWGREVVGVDLTGPFTQVAAGGLHSLGLRADGSIVGWGSNVPGLLNVPAPNTGFVGVSAGGGIIGPSHSFG